MKIIQVNFVCVQELKANQQEELGLAEKGEEDMDLSDEEEKPKMKKETRDIQVIDLEEEPEAKRIKMMGLESKIFVKLLFGL